MILQTILTRDQNLTMFFFFRLTSNQFFFFDLKLFYVTVTFVGQRGISLHKVSKAN